jgi:hypothetical protein
LYDSSIFLELYAFTFPRTLLMPTSNSSIPQIFMLDNLDLGLFTTKHDILPRIAAFDQAKLRTMTTMASDIGKTSPSYSAAPVSNLVSGLTNHAAHNKY